MFLVIFNPIISNCSIQPLFHFILENGGWGWVGWGYVDINELIMFKYDYLKKKEHNMIKTSRENGKNYRSNIYYQY